MASKCKGRWKDLNRNSERGVRKGCYGVIYEHGREKVKGGMCHSHVMECDKRQNLAPKWQVFSFLFLDAPSQKVESPATFWQSATKKRNFLPLFGWHFQTTFEQDFA